MTLKVLHLISGGDKGGAKTHIFSLMQGLKDLCQAKIICFIRDSFYHEAKALGIDIQVLEQKNRADMSVINEIKQQVKNNKYDIVHSHGARANTVAFFLKRSLDLPMVTTIHSDYELDFRDNFYKRIIFTSINKIALKKFDYYVAITEDFKSMLVDRGFEEDKIYVMYNGIDTGQIEVPDNKEDFLKRYKISDTYDFYLGQAARMDAVKNIEMTIRTAKILKDQGLNLAILLAGDGDQRKDLEDLSRSLGVEDMVYFLGFVKDKYSLFNAIDVNLLTSRSESFPYAILEASIMKSPTVATRVGGIPEQIRHGKDGYLVEVDDYEDMARRISDLYHNPSKVEFFRENIYNNVVNNFSIEAMAQSQYAIYEDIVKKEQ